MPVIDQAHWWYYKHKNIWRDADRDTYRRKRKTRKQTQGCKVNTADKEKKGYPELGFDEIDFGELFFSLSVHIFNIFLYR